MQAHEQWQKPWQTIWPRMATFTPQEKEEQRRRDAQTIARARAARADDPRPNVLFIFTDQQTIGAMSCSGNPHVNTPHMDRLAERGVRFTRSYCTGPVCGPARSSLVTGRMPHEVGVLFNGDTPDPAVPNMGHLFRDAGYEAAWCGKWHLPESYVHTFDGIPGFDNVARRREGPSLFGLGDSVDFLYAMDAVFLLRWELEKIGLPWLLCVSLHNPHDICHWTTIPPLRHVNLDRYPPLPDNFAVPPDEPDVLQAIRAGLGAATNQEIVRTGGWDGAQWRAYREAYYHMAEQVDRAIGLILAALEQGGWLENTLVVFTSDHGDGSAAHRWVAKNSLYDEPTAVPFIVSFPGRVPEGVVDEEHLVSGLDVLPTVCDYAGVAAPPTSGRSLRAAIEDPSAPWRDYVVAELTVGEREGPMLGRMVRSGRYKYCAYSAGAKREQLFDMVEDPGEMHDLSAQPTARAALDEHRAMLREWTRTTADAFPLIG